LGNNWTVTALILSALAMVLMLMIAFAKERVKVDLPVPSIKEIASTVFGNRYLVTIIATLILYMGTNFGMTITPFMANDVFHDPNLTSVMLGLGIIPTLLVAPLTPWLIRKFGKIFILRFSMIITIVFSVLMWLVGYSNVPLFLGLLFVKSLLGGFFMIAGALYFADCIEYDFHTKGKRFEAATFASQTFSNKMMSAVSGAGAMWLLAAYGFMEAKVGETVTQGPVVVQGMWDIFNLGPAVGAAIALVVFWKFYDLSEKKLAAIAEERQA
jgi:Na+/melibiose symporter-like transporter